MPGLKLKEASLSWAMKHLTAHGDTDLFPRPFELDLIGDHPTLVINALKNIDIASYAWRPSRRFLVPKGYLAFRPVTQLDPLDSILLSAIIFEIGSEVENRRRPTNEHSVFSYRFVGSPDGTLYSENNAWDSFWRKSKERAQNAKFVLVTDIADFYNPRWRLRSNRTDRVLQTPVISCAIDTAQPRSCPRAGLAPIVTDEVAGPVIAVGRP